KNPSLKYLTGEAEESDLVILMDCNAFSRTETLSESLSASPAPKVLIDHHLNPDSGSFNLVFSTPDISSASELTFWILKALGWDLKDREIGEALLTGMTTDTNNFANSVFPTTFTMASELIAAGVDRDAVLQKIYFSYRENRVRLMGYMQNQGLTVLPEGAAYMILTKEIQKRFDFREGESEGLVNVPLSIKEVRLSLLLKEDNGHFRVSLRSKKGTSAQACAVKYFNGGGHENAAGGKLFPEKDLGGRSLEEYIEKALLESL
ncbi:MAG: bifunctional oligoribonuclease/PAP phosphatase NrnA, partial [Bacteroidales bacterium]|nr:bifunctional oligoribonuclease/PAP phosphatase NrnA [Bacteroidales bacterium]